MFEEIQKKINTSMPYKADGFAPIVTSLNLTLKMVFIDRVESKNKVSSDIYFSNDLDH